MTSLFARFVNSIPTFKSIIVQWKLLYRLTFLFLVTYLFHSCKKELSCESCIGNNQPPIALAGPDVTITLPIDSVMLDGSRSSDPDGKISAWQWTKVSGPASSTIVNATAVTTTVKH